MADIAGRRQVGENAVFHPGRGFVDQGRGADYRELIGGHGLAVGGTICPNIDKCPYRCRQVDVDVLARVLAADIDLVNLTSNVARLPLDAPFAPFAPFDWTPPEAKKSAG